MLRYPLQGGGYFRAFRSFQPGFTGHAMREGFECAHRAAFELQFDFFQKSFLLFAKEPDVIEAKFGLCLWMKFQRRAGPAVLEFKENRKLRTLGELFPDLFEGVRERGFRGAEAGERNVFFPAEQNSAFSGGNPFEGQLPPAVLIAQAAFHFFAEKKTVRGVEVAVMDPELLRHSGPGSALPDRGQKFLCVGGAAHSPLQLNFMAPLFIWHLGATILTSEQED